jgi:hypothetical protein
MRTKSPAKVRETKAKKISDLSPRKGRAVKGGVIDYREGGLNNSTHKRPTR